MKSKIKSVWDKAYIKDVEFANRIVRSATNDHLGDLEGNITQEYLEQYETLAKSGIGLIITSHLSVYKYQRADRTHICVNEHENFDKLKLLTTKIHKHDSKVIGQIAGGGQKAINVYGKEALTPSGLNDTTKMTKENITECIKNFVKAVYILQETGFDGVQLHLAHGYLLSNFLNPNFNKRTDEYGGSLDNRYRIIHEILGEIKKLIKSDFLVTVKLNSSFKKEEGELFEEQLKVCKMLENDGVDAIEVSGNFKDFKQEEPYFINQALRIKQEIEIPIILVGGFREITQMQDAINKGIDFISMSRPFINDSNFIDKLKQGKKSKCISCNECFNIYKTHFKACVFKTNTNKQLEKNYKEV